MKDEIQIRCSIQFKNNLEKVYPTKKSTKERIKELNNILEDLIYGKKK